MCGRYTLSTVDGPDIAQRFGLLEPPVPETLGRANICPTEQIAVVVPAREIRAVPWGLRPFRNGSFAPINVRAETALSRFKWLMDGKRCLVIADGWYEWLKAEKKSAPRIPFRYTVDGGVPFAFAGRWDERRVGGEPVASAVILTTAANAVCAPVHDRMPCILAGPEEEAAWLSGELEPAALAELLVPLAAGRTAAAPANPAVNRAGVEGPELLEPPASEPASQLSLM
jgi:putative SOS response-associated peptidase YedK